MKRGGVPQANENCCANCNKIIPGYETIQYGSIENSNRLLCNQCYNQEVAGVEGLDKFQHVNFTPVSLADRSGENHEFHFRVRLFGPGVALDAFELHDGEPGGYQFQMIGDPKEDLFELFSRLLDRIRRALSIKYLENSRLGLQIANQLVRGRIEWDETQDGNLPCLVVDGRKVGWDDFGRMLMTFEGFQFELKIRDKNEEF